MSTVTEHPVAFRETRELPDAQLTLRLMTVDDKNRTVEVVVATSSRATVYDWNRDVTIDEILVPEGLRFRSDSIPVLDSHHRWGVDSILGSARGATIEGEQLVATLHIATGDQRFDRVWGLIRDKHLDSVSAGYRCLRYTDIAPGETQTVEGKSYTAGERTLRVTLEAEIFECSLIPVGADPQAKTRGFESMPIHLRQYLESIGLQTEATEADAWSFYRGLAGDQRAHADQLKGTATPPTVPNPESQRQQPAPAPANTPTNPPLAPEGQRSAPPANPPATPQTPTVPRSEVELERARVSELYEIAGSDIPDELVRAAVTNGTTPDQFRSVVLNHMRSNGRREPVTHHTRGREADMTPDVLAAAMMLREGMQLDSRHFGDSHLERRLPTYLFRAGSNSLQPEDERVLDLAHRYAGMSMMDFCRACCELDGQPVSYNPETIMERAFSGSSLSAIFTTSVNAMLLMGYMEADDSTRGWVSETEVANFKENERSAMGKFGPLKKHQRGGTAEHMDVSDSKETYKIGRYSGQFVIDEMDVIDDAFGALEEFSPRDIGASARQMRADLVYSFLLANAALGADGVALFDAATHANYGTNGTALAAATLQAGITAMGKHRQRERPLNIKPRFLLVPQDLVFTAEILITSAQRVISTDSGGTANPLNNRGITIVGDDRMGAAGVGDPTSDYKTTRTGSATNWGLVARPGENGAKTIEVAYLRGTGRAPRIRKKILEQGQWGIGWDINHDIGGAPLDYRGMYWATGAGG